MNGQSHRESTMSTCLRPSKSSVHKGSGEAPWGAVFHVYYHISWPGKVGAAHESTGRGQLEASLLGLSAPCTSSFGPFLPLK